MMDLKMDDLFGADLDEVYVRSCQKPAGGQEKEDRKDMDANQRALLRTLKDPGLEKIECFGGVLFKRCDQEDNPILSFAVEGLTEEELSEMKLAYKKVYRSGLSRVISRADPFEEQAGSCTVFNFEYNTGYSSLREYSRSKSISVETVMRPLVKLLTHRYNSYVKSDLQYESLNCLTLDTLFVDADGALWLLPLQAFRNRFPGAIAPEAHDPTQVCTEASDLFSAAYVAVEVANGGKMPAMLALKENKIKECLIAIPQCRPSLQTMVTVLQGARTAAEERGEERPVSSSAPRKTQMRLPDFSQLHLLQSVKDWWTRFLEALKKLFAWEPVSQTGGTLQKGTRRRFRPIGEIEEDED